MLTTLKRKVENLPEAWAKPLVFVPFFIRLGWSYYFFSRYCWMVSRRIFVRQIPKQRSLLYKLIKFAGSKNEFYKYLYDKNHFDVDNFQLPADWTKIPIVTKQEMKSFNLANRTSKGREGIRVNTGGTSGSPLEFLLDKRAFAREWAHMHFIWKSRGYKTSHVKLTFRGKHFESNVVLKFNAIHNEYLVNANSSMEDIIDAVLSLAEKKCIRWVHGYPSLVADFARCLSQRSASEIEKVRSRLFGVLLGSEYPAPIYRDSIEKILSSNIVSWYGHSEMCILAKEIAVGVYQSLPTYGFAEAVPTDDGASYRLVVTSYLNQVHPFIRYDTGDLIEPISQSGGVLTFRIARGRIGDYIEDAQGKRHSLTAIIFGRHHEAFNKIQHLQIRQESPRIVTLVITLSSTISDTQAVEKGFDLDDLPFEWRYEFVAEPIRTSAGKIKLKI